MKGQKTGGRTKGTPNKDKLDLLSRFMKVTGREPMEVIALAVKKAVEQAENTDEPREKLSLYTAAAQIAKDALPYMYARLAQIEHKGEIETHYIARVPTVAETTDEWLQQHRPTVQ